jgi:hypothetical protein
MLHIEFEMLNIKMDKEYHKVGCSQPVSNNLGMSRGIGVSCNIDKDVSTTAYSEDKDYSASSVVENVSC